MTDYMLDTCTCSFLIRKRPASLLEHLQLARLRGDRVVISNITYTELLFGAVGKKASPHHLEWVEDLIHHLDAVEPYDAEATLAASRVRQQLTKQGQLIGFADTMLAGHALACSCVFVTNNTREFMRVEGLSVEDWTEER